MTPSTTSSSAPQPPDRLAETLGRYGVTVADRSLLERAIQHRSYVAEHPGTLSNERLEFLGDAVLGWVVADLAFRRFEHLPEGQLTGVRKGVVNATALAEVARTLHLGDVLRLGRGEDQAGGRAKVSILSDALEAVVGAIYLDQGPRVVHGFVEQLFVPLIDDVVERLDALDHKSFLQEILAGLGLAPARYSVASSSGPDHAKRFTVVVRSGDDELGTGEGGSKKAAEQVAAAAAVAALQERAAGGDA